MIDSIFSRVNCAVVISAISVALLSSTVIAARRNGDPIHLKRIERELTRRKKLLAETRVGYRNTEWLRQQYRVMDAAFARCQRIFQRRAQNESLPAIARAEEVSLSVIKGTLRGRTPLEIYRSPSLDKRVSLPAHYAAIIPGKSWAFVLGAYASRTGHPPRDSFDVHHVEARPLHVLATAIGRSTVDDVHVQKSPFGGWMLRYTKTALPRLLHERSQGNQRILWEELLTLDEVREFLRGYLTFSRGWIDERGERFKISTTSNVNVMRDIAVLMKQSDIVPAVRWPSNASQKKERRMSLIFEGHAMLAQLAELDPFADVGRRDRLRQMAAAAKPRRAHTAQTYRSAMALSAEIPSLTPGDVARELTRLDPTLTLTGPAVSNWRKGGRCLAHERLCLLEELERKKRWSPIVTKARAVLSSRLADPAYGVPAKIEALARHLLLRLDLGMLKPAQIPNSREDLLQMSDRRVVPQVSTLQGLVEAAGIEWQPIMNRLWQFQVMAKE